jgi:hypothetical protein
MLLQQPFKVEAQQTVPPTSAGDERWITVRLSPDISDETLGLINEIALPKQINVREGENLNAAIKERYGDAYMMALRLFQKLNSQGALRQVWEGKGGQLLLPVVPNYHKNVIMQLLARHDLRALVERATGITDKSTRDGVIKYTSRLKKYCEDGRGCTREEMALVGRDNVVALPFASRFVSFRLKDIGQEKLSATLARLEDAKGVTDLEVHKSLRLVPNFDAAQASHIRPDCMTDPASTDWPSRQLSLAGVSVDDLRAAANPTTIAILDTGIALNDPRFTFWQNDPEVNGSDFVDEDRNEYRDDKIGYDFVNKRPYPLDDMFGEEFRNHGTHVAGLACGLFYSVPPTEAVGSVLSEASRHIRPMILKVAWENGEVDGAAVIEAIQYAYDMGARVVNMSFSGQTFIKSIKKEIARSPKTLFVAAAGNGDPEHHLGQNLDTADYFPAKFSKDLPNLISVAAHGEHLERPCFSNFGATTVDIAAPGVQVESTVAGGYLRISGTSQAAPLVTMTAALLNSQGMSDPVLIKQRILASVDYVPDFRGQLTSEGVLNIAKTLGYRDDLIELSDTNRTLLRGRIINPPAEIVIGGRSINFADIRKIVSFSPEEGAVLQRVTLLNRDKLEHIYGSLTFPKIKFKEKGKQDCVELDLSSVRDIIPASVPTNVAETCPNQPSLESSH